MSTWINRVLQLGSSAAERRLKASTHEQIRLAIEELQEKAITEVVVESGSDQLSARVADGNLTLGLAPNDQEDPTSEDTGGGGATPPSDVAAGTPFDMIELRYVTATKKFQYRSRQITVNSDGTTEYSTFGAWTDVFTASPYTA